MGLFTEWQQLPLRIFQIIKITLHHLNLNLPLVTRHQQNRIAFNFWGANRANKEDTLIAGIICLVKQGRT